MIKSRFLPGLFVLFLMTNFSVFVKAQNYEEVWNHINNNERDKAALIIEGRLKSNTASVDEFITYNFLKAFNGQEREIKDFKAGISKADNPDPYIYSLWFSPQVVGQYGKKGPFELDLLNSLVTDKARHGTLRAAAHYSLGHHYVGIHQFAMMNKENEKIGALLNWQFVGPFNNVSGSGFNKNYEPIKDTSNSSVFLSSNQAPIKWFTPIEKSTEGWIPVTHFIAGGTAAITFAQTFVNSPVEQDVYLCTGFTGNMKLWLNDQLVLSVPEERLTEMDVYNTKCRLKAGYNRILVQVGSDASEPNFIVRVTNSDYEPITNISSTATPHSYVAVGGEQLNNQVPLFAESYFIEKIKKEPKNIVNYMLLSRVYLRSRKDFEARKNIEQALALAPNNSLLKYELLLCYINEGNRTGISESYEYFKKHEKQSLIAYSIRHEELKRQKKYQEVLDTLQERINRYGNNESTYDAQIQALANLDQVPKLVDLIDEAYKKYSDEALFINYVFNVEKSINKNPKKATKLLDGYLKTHYSYELNKLLIAEYFSQHNTKRPYQILNEQIDAWPYSPSIRVDLLSEYLGQQRYNEAEDLCNFMLKMKPYSGYYYQNKARVQEALNKTQDAIDSYQMAFRYEPTLYESRDKQRRLQGKKNLLEHVSHDNVDELIAKTGTNIKTENYDYYYIKYETNEVIYPEGGRERIHTSAIKVLNQRGIDRNKEFSLPYNENSEVLEIEDVQLIKADGKKTKPEVSYNQIVWTGLEANDVIYFKYKVKSYLNGKFAQEFYDKFVFDGFIPVELAKYTLVMPKTRKFNYKVVNGETEFDVTDYEDYKIYNWQKTITTPIREEPYMPPSADFATTLHISTMENWNEVAQWYSDVVYSKIATDNDYEVLEVYKKLFEGKTNLSAEKKAKIIYDYIAENINYSSVPFRQSAIIPQKASKTINTHLGDCKDISTLFVSLANLCGLKTNLVLVSTRDNGQKDMLLPSFLFNHCIVKYYDEKGSEIYLELTDREMPFKSLPGSLYQAMALTIPAKGKQEPESTLLPINTSNKTVDKIISKIKINVSGNEMNLTNDNVKYGSLSSGDRQTFRSLNPDMANDKIQESMSQKFTTPVKVNTVAFEGLDQCLDSVKLKTSFTVSSAIKKIGNQYAFQIPFIDAVFTAPPFSLEKRKYDFEYWDYETVDEYETNIEIVLPDGKMFVDIPKNEKLTFRDLTYSLSFTKSAPGKLIISRTAHINRNNITSEEYADFKAFMSKVIDAEGAYVTFN